jgi:DUF2950 family protein
MKRDRLMTLRSLFNSTKCSARIALLACAALTIAPLAAQEAVRTFATPEEAVRALAAAVKAGNLQEVIAIFAPYGQDLADSSDPATGRQNRQIFVAAFAEGWHLVNQGANKKTLVVGNEEWPLPVPLVKTANRWRFDSAAGKEEVIARRIGRNELAAIRACLAYVTAQKAFHAMTEKSGQPEYAQLLASTPGRHDGLYWPSREGEPESPLAPLMAQAVEEGYPGERAAGKRVPYHGYFFRILTAQGASTPDGSRTYISNGRMTGGFALVAWPALYGASGIMSFIVNQDGTVFQKDLGPNTAWLGVTMMAYDPDLSWTRVDIEDDN